MDRKRFENANKLWAEGHTVQAACEFHAMAEEVDYPDEKAAILANEHKCYCQVDQLDKAQEVMREIRSVPVQDKFVRMIVDIGDACMTALIGKFEEGVFKFERILEFYRDELRNPENRNLYEDIQERRGFALTTLRRYDEAIPILKEAISFTIDSDPQLVHFYLGICYQGTSNPAPAKEAFLHAISLGLGNDFEADARYRLAILYYRSGALAQAKNQLELALQMPEQALSAQLRKNIYQQMSSVCHYLREFDEEKKYTRLAQAS